MTIETDPTNIAGRQRRRPSARFRFALAFVIGLILTLGLGVGALYAYDQQYAGRVLPGVRIGDVDLSGMSAEAARSTIDASYASLSDGRIVVNGPTGTSVITYAEIGRGVDTDALVAEALAVGRDGSAIDRAVANARTAVRGVDLEPRVRLDAARLATRVAAAAAGFGSDPVEASVKAAEGRAYEVVAGRPGFKVDAGEVAAALALQLADIDAPNELAATLPVKVTEPTVTTAEATEAKAAADRIVGEITLVLDDTKVPLDTAKIREWVTFEITADGRYEARVDTSKVPTLLTGVAKKVDRKAVNAEYKTSGTKVSGVKPSKNGYALDVAATTKQVEALLAARALGTASTEIRPTVKVTEPALTTAEAEAAAPKMKRISRWTTYFPITDRNGFGANIWLPALAIDGMIVGPHEKFDFWKAVGPVTREKGYRQGAAIINGKTDPDGAFAGGICSCSTTLFNAALRAGFDMGARKNHFYYIDRYPLGLDATVFISGPNNIQSMSWTNDTDYPVLIRGYKIRKGGSGYVRFDLYSVPTGRVVKVGAPTVKNVRKATDTVEKTSTLPKGATKRIEYPVDGKQVWRTVTVRDANGVLLHRDTYYSNYARITGVTLVGE